MNKLGLLSLENGIGVKDVKVVPNETSPFVATCGYYYTNHRRPNNKQ
jgi:hypothetical protein